MKTNQEKLSALKEEKAALDKRIGEVHDVLYKRDGDAPLGKEYFDLIEQLRHMENYTWILHKRILFIERPGVHHTEGVTK